MKLRLSRVLPLAVLALLAASIFSQPAAAQEITYYTFDDAPGTFSYDCQDTAHFPAATNPPLCFNDLTNPGSGTNPSLVTDTFPPNLNPGGDGSAPHTAMQLNPAAGSHAESAWFSVPQKISNGFTSYFAFKLSQGTFPPADGFAFVVQNADGNDRPNDPDTGCSENGSGPTVVGGGGGCLGYSGIDDSLAVEFDTFTNGYDPAGDINGGANHIAVQSCGSGVNSSSHLPETGCELGINNALSESLYNGQFHEVVVEYSGAAGTPANLLQVYLDPAFIPGTHTPIDGTVPVVSVTYNIQSNLGLINGDSAYVGFTGATGSLFENQEIAAWTFTPHTPVSQQETLQPAGDNTPFPFGAHTYGVTYPPTGPDPSVDMIVTANTISPALFDILIATAPPPLNTTHCQIFDSTGGNCVIYSITCVATGTTGPPVNCPTTADPSIVVKTAFESFNGADPLTPGFIQGDPFYTAITQVAGNGTSATATCGGKCGVSVGQSVTILNNSLTGASATVTATSVTIDTFSFVSAVNGTGTGGFVTSTNLSDIFVSYSPQKIDGTTSGKTKNFSDFVATGIEPIAFLSTNSAQGYVSAPFKFTVSASGYPSPTLTETTGTLPSELTFVNGVISGTPATEGVYNLNFHAKNNTVAPAQDQTFTLTISPGNVFTSGTSTNFTVGTLGNFPVTATGTPTPTISTTSFLPNGVFFDGAALQGTPAAGTAGNYPITFTATNGAAPDVTQSFSLIVSDAGTAPLINSASSTTFMQGTAGSFSVTATGSPASSFSTTGLPSGVSLSSGGALTSTTGAAAGIYTFTIKATNGISPDATQLFTLTIQKPPAFTSGASTTFTFGTAGSFHVTASGVPAPTFSTSGLPSGVSLSTAGLLTSTATAAANVYHFTITASNGVSPDATQNFTLTIQGGAPQFTSAATTTFTAGIAGSFNVTASGTPAPTFKVYSGSLPSGVSLSGAGLLKSSTSAKAGTYNFGIKATNGKSPDATQAFTLIIQQPVGSISLSPTSVAFGDVFLGTKTHKAISITNTSTQPVMITKLTFTAGTGPSKNDYGYDFECGDILKPGQKCTVTIELHAQDIGPGTSTLNIFFNGPTAQVGLSGNVINPKAKLSTSSLSFGNVKVGTSVSKSVMLTNNGDSDLLISSIVLSGNSDFSKTTNTCSATLAKNLSCSVTIKFAPTAKSSRTGTLKFTDNANPTTQSVSITGKGN